jgi:hypothetical protein
VPSKNVLFLSSHLSRPLVTFAKKLSRDGFAITIAAPKNKNLQFLNGNFIELSKIGKHLFGAKKIHNFDGKIFYFDQISERFLHKNKIAGTKFFDDIGVDLKVWTPDATSGNRQTMLLAKYNIMPHQKMILLLEPNEKDIKSLILAIQGLDRDDFVIAMHGEIPKNAALRISKKIKNIPQIIYIGTEQDLPTLMRASFAIMYLSGTSSFFKMASIAMGRTTIWKSDTIKPNIVIKTNLTETIESVLDLTIRTRENYEKDNLSRAENYSIEKNILKIKNMIK